MSGEIDAWLARLRAAGETLIGFGELPLAELVTEPDPKAGETWTGRQVMAHVAELLPYWLGEVDELLGGSGRLLGRRKDDPDRMASVHADSDLVARADLVELVARTLRSAEERLAGYRDADLDATGEHLTRGQVSARLVLETFVVDHVEEHAEQLSGAVARWRAGSA